MYVIFSEVRFVEISPPNECDKILKIKNEQTEPTDYMANCSTDASSFRDNILKCLSDINDNNNLLKFSFFGIVLLV